MLSLLAVASLAFTGPPVTTLEDAWLDFIDRGFKMTAPNNWNLSTTDISGKKVLIPHDSTGVALTIRDLTTMPTLVGEFGMTLAGAQIPATGPSATTNLNSLGAWVQPKTVTNLTHSRVDVGSNYADGDDAEFNITEAREMSSTANLANFTDLVSVQARAAGFDAFDLSGAMRMTTIIHDHSGGFLRLNLEELRDTSVGNNDNYGSASDTASTAEGGTAADGGKLGDGTDAGGMSWDQSGDVKVIRKGIRPAANMSGGSDDVGLTIRTSGGDETSKSLRLLTTIIQKVDVFGDGTPKVNDPQAGTLFCFIGESGANVRDLIDNHDSTVYDAMVRAVGGFDTVLIPLGLNPETGGETYSNNIPLLIAKINLAHTSQGFSAPSKYILDAPYVAGDAAERTALRQISEDAFTLAQANGYGFINRARMYNYQSPGELDQRWPSGTSAAYTMDSGDLHPANTTTAANLARDRLESFKAENIVTTLPSTARIRNIRSLGIRDD